MCIKLLDLLIIVLKVSGTLLGNEVWEDYPAAIVLSFDQTVRVTESFYPSLSLTDLCANLGGSLGLWLGIGLLQIFFYAVDLMDYVKATLKLNI